MRRRYTASQARLSIAELAARLIAEEGIASYQLAKQKAAERLGMKGRQHWPDNREIEAVLSQYQQLFQGQTQAQYLHAKRKIALAAMRFLTPFSPRLVGPVLSGTACEHTGITLHVFTDTLEDIALVLSEHGIPYELGERRLRQSPATLTRYPCYQFMAGEVPVELVVFTPKEIHHPPLSPVDGKPMRRADRLRLEEIVSESSVTVEDVGFPPGFAR